MQTRRYDWRPPQWALRAVDGWLAFAMPQPEPGPLDRRERLVCPSGAIRWFASDRFLAHGSFYPPRLAGFELPWRRAIDIDEPGDLEMARCVAFALDGGFAFAA